MRIEHCYNIEDFRSIARRRPPGPIFHYIDGAADDAVTYRRNAEAYERCDLVPNVLAGVESIDMSTTVMLLDMPLFCSPTRFSGCSIMTAKGRSPRLPRSSAQCSAFPPWERYIEEIGSTISTPKLFQLYFHKDRGLTNSMIERCIAANFDVLALTVDTITGGNRERDLRTGFTSPPRLTLKKVSSASPRTPGGRPTILRTSSSSCPN